MPMVANTAGTRAALEFRGSFELFTVGPLTQHPGVSVGGRYRRSPRLVRLPGLRTFIDHGAARRCLLVLNAVIAWAGLCWMPRVCA